MIRRTPLPQQRSWRLAPVAAALTCTAALAISACGGSSSSSSSSAGGSGDPSGSSQTLTLYNAQHEETTAALIKAFTAADGDQGPGQERRRVGADRADRAGGAAAHRPTSSTPRTPTGSSSSTTAGCWRRSKPRRLPQSRHGQRGQRRLGRRLGPVQRADLQPEQDHRRTAAQVGAWISPDPQYKGKLELAPGETDFWPIVTSIERAKGKPRRSTGSRRSSPTPAPTTTPPTTRRSSATSARASPTWA